MNLKVMRILKMNNGVLRGKLKYHTDCGGWGCESVGYYIPYEDVKEASLKYIEWLEYNYEPEKALKKFKQIFGDWER